MALLTKITSKPIIITALIVLTCLGAIIMSLFYLLTNQQKDDAAQARTINSPTPSHHLPQEFRGVWIATVENIDCPSRSGLPIAAQQHEFAHLLDQVAQMHLNAVVVQIKPEADAFYPSRYGPWS